jgi:hypothetical protein
MLIGVLPMATPPLAATPAWSAPEGDQQQRIYVIFPTQLTAHILAIAIERDWLAGPPTALSITTGIIFSGNSQGHSY